MGKINIIGLVSFAVLVTAGCAIFGLQQEGDTSRLLTTIEVRRELDITHGVGVNINPLIMGLSGQMIKFKGHSGAWYSAISTPSMQWNMRLQNYESCPEHSKTFLSGVGLTFSKKGNAHKRIEISVANPHNEDVNCGGLSLSHCLGAGSLELIIDGFKHSIGGDYKFHGGTGRIIAFNTFHQCSRKWYDVDVGPTISTHSDDMSIHSDRSLHATLEPEASAFDIIEGLKETMVDREACEKWLQDRKQFQDLFKQPGHYTTVIIKTEGISLHLEYKQENERCHAHSIDVWISSVDPSLLEENWKGIIGETKDLSYSPKHSAQKSVDQMTALQFADDSDYKVNSPFSRRCKGCSFEFR